MSFIATLLLLFFFSLPATAQDSIESLSDGPPEKLGKVLGEKSYVKFQAKRFARAKVLWLNFKALEELGIKLPPGGLTPEFEKRVLDAFAYGIPGAKESPDAFTAEEKTFFADRYGGEGMGTNFGSGRAGIAGKVQIKGIGRTDLVGVNEPFDHAHGRSSIYEGIQEAVFGEVTQELPHKGNRILALIGTDTHTHWHDGGKDPNALIVRLDPNRPAHYYEAIFGDGPLKTSEAERMKEVKKFLPDALPGTGSTRAEKLSSGINEFTARVARQHAALFVRRLYHGTTSPSNIDVNGALLDYGTMTAQPGHGKVHVLPEVAPAGDFESIHFDIGEDFLETIKKTFPPEDTALLPTEAQLKAHFNEALDEALPREFLALTGAPEEMIQKIEKSDAAKKLARTLYKDIATAGTDTAVFIDKQIPSKIGKHDLALILTTLAEAPVSTPEGIAASLKGLISDEALRGRLGKEYADFLSELSKEAGAFNVERAHLKKLMAENAAIRNRKLTHLYRPNLAARSLAAVQEYERNGNRSRIWETVDELIEGARQYRDLSSPHLAIIGETHDVPGGMSRRHLFNAKTGHYEVKLTLAENDKVYNFFGHRLDKETLLKTRLVYSTDNWGSVNQLTPEIERGKIVFTLPLKENSQQVSIALRSTDSKTWWKNGDQNIELKIGRQNGCSTVYTQLNGLLGK